MKDLYNPAKELPPFDLEVKNVVPTLSIENANAIFEDAEKSIIRSDQNVSSSEEGFGTYSIDTTPTGDDFCHNHGSVEIDPDNGEITYKPALNYHTKTSPCKITVEFDDKKGGKVSNTFNIPVISVDDKPIAIQIDETFVEDENHTILIEKGVDYTDADQDKPRDVFLVIFQT